MSIFLKQIVKQKIKKITYDDILFYSEQYGFSIDEQQAREMANYLTHHDLDPFDATDRKMMFQTLAQITDKKTAEEAEQLLFQLIKTYGLEHLFLKNKQS